ncbi:restriction endonuclease subunit S [Pediococcus pentosaceus]|uniref:restriction endonuclease subunit S n=1 Tax=Pediococcus pentosaceus TaxID=1255 RepID=UPI002DE41D79|nr:restriction endonuclease subunit S [Pediococcus pentosaceus]MEC5141822.1 restriction endonuclease subunit S [Pediococcus pentosaceus]
MKDNQAKYPQLRFKGFTNPWEKRKLGELMDVTSVRRIHQSDWRDKGVPFYRARDLVATAKGKQITDPIFISEKTYEEYSIQSGKVRRGELLVTGVGTLGVAYLVPDNKPLYFKDGNVIWFKNATMNGDFLYYSFTGERTQRFIKLSAGTGTVGTYTIDTGKKTPISVPSHDEQIKVGTFFSHLDRLIAVNQRKLAKLKELKQGYLQKMFPRNGSKFPQLRFAGFADAWEQRKFGELYKKNLERNKDHFSSDRTISIATMRFKKEGNGAAENSLVSYKVLREGDIAFEGHTSKRFAFGRFVLNDIGDGIMSPRFTTLRPTQDMPIKFWKQYIHYEPIMRYPIVNSTKLGTMMNELVVDEFLNQPVLVPELSEQEKIGSFFQQLDETIALHQRKLEKLQELKKGYLQKMFC